MFSRKSVVVVGGIVALVAAGVFVNHYLTWRPGLARRCAVEFFREHGAGWALTQIDHVAESTTQSNRFYVEGVVTRGDQQSIFYLTIVVGEKPGGSCTCAIDRYEIQNDRAFEPPATEITLPPVD